MANGCSLVPFEGNLKKSSGFSYSCLFWYAYDDLEIDLDKHTNLSFTSSASLYHWGLSHLKILDVWAAKRVTVAWNKRRILTPFMWVHFSSLLRKEFSVFSSKRNKSCRLCQLSQLLSSVYIAMGYPPQQMPWWGNSVSVIAGTLSNVLSHIKLTKIGPW